MFYMGGPHLSHRRMAKVSLDAISRRSTCSASPLHHHSCIGRAREWSRKRYLLLSFPASPGFVHAIESGGGSVCVCVAVLTAASSALRIRCVMHSRVLVFSAGEDNMHCRKRQRIRTFIYVVLPDIAVGSRN